MARKKLKPKLPPLLSLAYSNHALDLQHAIVSLLPPSQSTCICEGSGCVICCGAHAILRPSDPITYRQLVTRAVVVAPVGVEGMQRPVVDLVRQVSQHEIVSKAMAWILAGSRPYDNLLCKSYDQMSRTSLSGKILCSSDWCLLLERVGDSVMEFILRHYSIFVPPSKWSSKAFIQVTGIPVTKSLRYSKASSLGSTGQKKRTRVEIAKSADSQPCAHNGGKKRKRDEFANNNEENSNCSVEKKRNRRRLYSWQRRKQQKMDSQISKDDFERTFQNEIIGSNINIMPKSQRAKEKCPCFYCFVLHSSRKIPIHSQIQRRYIFYSKSFTQSLFPKNHILNQLKANDSGALSLMKRIFGNRDSYSNFMQRTSCGDSARSRSNCLHHSFVALFKSLIRNAQRCNHRRLLHRHCFVRHKVFIVVADVKKAFDSIDQDMLLRIIRDVIVNEEYSLGKYTHILMGKNRLNPIYKGSFGCINSNFSVQLSSNSGVFIDQASYQNIKKQLFYDLLFQHVKHNILHIGGKFYEQKVGIAQGSILSTLLCSFYFGHLEETLIWPFLKKLEKGNDNEPAPHSLLMRYLDDFIFVSTCEKQAMGFLERVKRGFGDYNCFMNDAKYGWNFEVNRGGFVNRRYIGEDGVEFIPWSGLLVNCNTLEIQADYTRYWGINMRSTITVNKNGKQSDLLRERLCGYMLPKCHMIFYDMKINSPATVRLNLYQAFLICAMKFHCYICEINDPITSKETLSIIQTTFSYMHTLLRKRTKEMKTSFGVHPEFLIKKNETVWLGISAYIRILKRKQSRYKELVHLLRENLAKCDVSVHPSNDLLYAVNDSHSSMFWKIKF
ncbi:hypothetical protein LUZ60_012539 [Juncus effusus]|nr:hypothetical protein LUZ60_012539 [Juncus effusus]